MLPGTARCVAWGQQRVAWGQQRVAWGQQRLCALPLSAAVRRGNWHILFRRSEVASANPPPPPPPPAPLSVHEHCGFMASLIVPVSGSFSCRELGHGGSRGRKRGRSRWEKCCRNLGPYVGGANSPLNRIYFLSGGDTEKIDVCQA